MLVSVNLNLDNQPAHCDWRFDATGDSGDRLVPLV